MRAYAPTELKERLRPDNDDGAALIMALVFVFAIGLVLVGILNLASSSLLNTTNLRSQRSVEFAADSATNASVQWARNSCPPSSPNTCGGMYPSVSTPVNCMPSTVTSMTSNGTGIRVWCSGAAPPGERQVDFFACNQTVLAADCTTAFGGGVNVLVHANITFFDSDPNGIDNCAGTTTSSCGIAMTVNSWDVRTSDN